MTPLARVAVDAPELAGGLRRLSRSESLVLLRSRRQGRLAFTREALPFVVPVGFCIEGARVRLYTRHPELISGAAGQVVTLECDGVDPHSRESWSVCATGRAGQPSRDEAVEQLVLEPELLAGWAAPLGEQWGGLTGGRAGPPR